MTHVRINNIFYLARKYTRIIVRGHCPFQDASSFQRAKLEENRELRGTDNVQGHIYEHVFAHNEGYCGKYRSHIFQRA